MKHTGSCLCGAVSFEVTGPMQEADACHCRQCRKQSGHFWASVDLDKSAVTIHGKEDVTWFQSSEKVKRGFCSQCGSFLFWDPFLKDKIAIATGAFDTPLPIKLGKHIFVSQKGDYYQITDDLPQNQT